MHSPELPTVLSLHCHPSTPCPAVDALQVQITPTKGGLHLRYTLSGTLAALNIPRPQAPTATDGLWEHTCFETFIRVLGENRYHEFNFSPSSQWAAYAFRAYRERLAWQAQQPPVISTAVRGNEFVLEALLASADLPDNCTQQPWQLGITAVLETTSGEKSYWALQHPATRPDFHHNDGFVHAIWS
ncbi:DOMON-like domain-containing protein [Thiothrix subterranea]|uniref:DOMON-like domain-containing protein n=1 Tax=Thiothrix subterranea TaxID=2735563 RepID=UPI00192B421B|nr:DOMON-like domain-containing protein [Thiothrix subterranea]